jgi:2-methylcitrate dehydratase PrpD
MTDYLDTLSRFVARCRFADLPAEVVERAHLVVADSVAAIAGGSAEPEVRALTSRVLGTAPRGAASVIGTTHRAEPAKAALINGTAGTFLELDEGNQFSRGHPAIHVVPAAFAYGEAHGVSGRELLLAIVLGYEIGARIGIAAKLRPSMHPHGTWGTVAAAVTVAKLAGADAAAIKQAINVSSTLGLATSRRTMLEGGTVRNGFAGISGQMGLLAHDMVAAGFTGERDGLATIFGSVVSESFDRDALIDGLGARWEIARNYFKRHACCRYNHATLDALDVLDAKRRLVPDEIASITVSTYSLATQLDDKDPQNTLAAKFSVPFAVATRIVNGASGLASFTLEAVRDPRIKALAQRVTVREDKKLTAMMPDYRPSRVRVTFTDGKRLDTKTIVNRGDSEDPYSPDELAEKYVELTGRVWDRAKADAIHEMLLALDGAPSLAGLTRALADAPRSAKPKVVARG